MPVYDLKIHPRDRELIAGTHGRGVMILGVSSLQQMSPATLSAQSHLFSPAPAFDYGMIPAPSEPRAQRPWRSEGGPQGAEIEYRLNSAVQTPVRVLIVSAAGDTIARLSGTGNAGINRVSWNLQPTGDQVVAADFGGGRGGRGGGRGAGPVANTPGFPPGFNPRPAESAAPPDSSGSPTAQARLLAEAAGRGGAGRGGRGGGGGGGRGNLQAVETGDYRVVLDVGGQKQAQVLRVVRVNPGDVAVLAPMKER